MASFTQSIREILQANKTPQQDLTNVNDVYNIASACLFDTMPENVISSEYRQQFITGFALHFFNEEIGYETLPLWKIALNEKIYNRGSYINKIFENLDNEIFADYRVKQNTVSGQHSNTKTGTGTLQNERVDNTTTTTEDSATKSELVENTLTGTVESDGTITHAKTGDDTVAKTGTDTKAKTGTDTVAKTGTDERAKTGYDTDTHTGTDASAHTGTQGTESSSSQETTNTGTTGTDHNLIQVQSDTPMGSLSNLRTPGGDARGTGVTYANGQTYNYMSGAQEVDESNVQTDNTEQDVTGSESSETTFNDTTTETKNLTDRAEYHSTETETLNLQDQTTYNSTDTDTLNLEDVTTYNSTDTETRDTIDTTSKTDNTQTTGTDEKTGTVTVDGNVTDTQTRNITDADAGTHSETGNETEHSLNWEMLYRSMPLLNKVWEQFDDLFMLIF